ncbi:MAG: hypothetical protein ETSY1_04490 [Candidatus Entotheonella factor]|uniref:Uncharacterized protein n=1 Tax=Entotheonella factor TaxID=1429438 RepID=W4LVM6_ENTF1|nr:MAG: hypothetical protein ETSY1_04490 [Candidatus Entotheonella factor]
MNELIILAASLISLITATWKFLSKISIKKHQIDIEVKRGDKK